MKTFAALAALSAAALLAPAAAAQVQTGNVVWEVSKDSGATWHSSIHVGVGAGLHFRARAAWTQTGPTVGFAGATFEQVDFAGSKSTDAVALILPFASSGLTVQPGTGDSAGGKKIDSTVFPFRVNFGQLPLVLPGGIPNPSFNSSNPYSFTLWGRFVPHSASSPLVATRRVIVLDGAWTKSGAPATNEFKVYTSAAGTAKKPVVEATQSPAYILITTGICAGDLDGDSDSDSADLAVFLNAYAADDLAVDFNGDHVVDKADYFAFLALMSAC